MPESYKEEVSPAVRRSGSAGFTIMEIMIVLAIIAMVAAGVILGFSSLSRSKLRSSAYLLAASAQRAFSYSTSRNESVRIILDLDEGELLFESTEGSVLIDKKAMEEEAEEEEEEKKDEEALEESPEKGTDSAGSPAFSLGVEQLAERIKSGFHQGEVPRYKPPTFTPVADRHLSENSLEEGVKFYAVYSQLFEEEKRTGKAYVYFFPDGTADHTAVQIQGKSGEIYTIEILPYSARVKIYDYPYVPPMEDEEED
jgi:prepilin-type N-terminal cleavage/methylation domain-containing protein